MAGSLAPIGGHARAIKASSSRSYRFGPLAAVCGRTRGRQRRYASAAAKSIAASDPQLTPVQADEGVVDAGAAPRGRQRGRLLAPRRGDVVGVNVLHRLERPQLTPQPT